MPPFVHLLFCRNEQIGIQWYLGGRIRTLTTVFQHIVDERKSLLSVGHVAAAENGAITAVQRESISWQVELRSTMDMTIGVSRRRTIHVQGAAMTMFTHVQGQLLG